MLKDCIEIFEKEIEKYKLQNPDGDEISFITDNYSLTAGTYYLLDIETGEVKETLEVGKSDDNNTTDLYRKFAKLEYVSMYIDSNKAVGDKNIFSNNIYSFIVKKENITEKINDDIIEGYFTKIIQFKETTDSDKKKLYIEYEKQHGKTDSSLAEKSQTAVKNFFKTYNPENQKGRLALFFDVDFEEYKKESNRYLLANIYNANKYNYIKNNLIFGLSNNNMGLNEKKTYLKNKSRKSELPYAVSQTNIMLQKLFFDDIKNKIRQKENNITKTSVEAQNQTVNYYMHLISENGEPIIDDYSLISNNEEVYIRQNNYLNNKDNYEYENVSKIRFFDEINKHLYNFKLKNNIYKKDIEDKKYPRLAQNIKRSNSAWGDWLFKNNEEPIKAILNEVCISRVLDTFIEPDDKQNWNILSNIAALRFNIFYSLKNHFLEKEIKEMSDENEFMQIYNKLKEKINSNTTQTFENNKEAFFAMGQIEYYLIYKQKEPKHDEAIPFLTSFYSKKAKNEILKLFRIRAYDIPMKWLQFNNLYAMIQEYNYPKKFEIENVLAGYLHNCVLLENNSKNTNNDNNEER